MRRIVMFNHVTLDGYFASPDDELDWVVEDPEIDKSAVAGMPEIDTILFGRRTYDQFARFWPHALDETAGPPPHGGERTPEFRAMAEWLNETDKIVFSKTLNDVGWNNTQLRHELDPREIEIMKRQPGRDMIVFGSGSVVTQLAEHDLIDEYRFVLNPVLLGTGRQLFAGLSRRIPLTLIDTRAYPSGCILLRYERRT